ncbi:Uncharacterised protein [Klebsiella pneumoniae]|mgnify:CR=1 FL=1|uniref:Uncharacterized protein n=1 Tax=Klebsiella pneumoniae TaxID=573 RepID=A0A332TLA1_KLEPN|nr:hypothetical protein L399_04067 [Klebsiella pneumoniae BWH 28]ESN43016.1 hypothetical protein L365_00264 [Klebsiella pneumoniae MGH 19]OUG54255.1 hypothetical protein AZZ86_000263 [Klebsiella pneumoniae]CDL21987.1 hypothetical protein [Klebsiella pneumoniae IS53]SLR17277.1 Uncharacterised protein [Klebsiella quasipneumoniae]SLU73298.1 Uncharacterised protein [Klebsiella variicola]
MYHTDGQIKSVNQGLCGVVNINRCEFNMLGIITDILKLLD